MGAGENAPEATARALGRRTASGVVAAWARSFPPLAVDIAMMLVGVALTAGVLLWPSVVRPSTFLLVEIVATAVLRLRALVVLGVSLILGTLLLIGTSGEDVTTGSLVTVVIATLLMLMFSVDRDRAGLQGAPSELMLVDLRDRLRQQSRIPALPPGWHVDDEVRPAHGDAFAGDFVVAGQDHPRALEIAVVDVSGHGHEAGVRSLQLSSAFGGLIVGVEPGAFMSAADAYVRAQGWEEGYASAAHLELDLTTGGYRLTCAGHPPALLRAADGHVTVLDDATGPLLGIPGAARWKPMIGVLRPGESIVLYTDGLVDLPGVSLDVANDRLRRAVERLGGTRAARRVIRAVGAARDDDQAVVVVTRSHAPAR